jgi:hypothetical protein
VTTSELDTIRKQPKAERVASLRDYLTRAEARITEARTLRDSTIRKLRADGLPRAEVATLAGVSVAHVAAVTAKPKT